MPDARIADLENDLHFGFIDQNTESHQIFDPRLVANQEQNTMLASILSELRNCHTFKFSVAFISASGLALLKQALYDFPGKGTLVTSRYLDFNEPNVFRELLQIDNLDVQIYDHPKAGFHAKGYIFEHSPFVTAIVGSSNLTAHALVANQEWNLRFSSSSNGNIAFQIESEINRQLKHCVPLTEEWISEYESTRKTLVREAILESQNAPAEQNEKIQPNSMQLEALAALDELVELGERRAVIVSATGTGKTILAALAAKQFCPNKVLFVVHREQIAKKALDEFQKVFSLPHSEFGRFTQGLRQLDCKFVFATSQTLAKPETLQAIDPELFDYIIIDESHHSGAESFKRIINHFKPEFLLGLTATPERTGNFNIFELFDYNLAYEIRLQKALEADLLVPFHYFGVADFTHDGATSDETSELAFLINKERVDYVVKMLHKYGYSDNVKGLMFCSRKEEARELSTLFNMEKVHGKKLRTDFLIGQHSAAEREAMINRLERSELDYILTVDIFNEGVDIPCINQIVMLRPTQSSIIFTQQLGRGLRKFKGKEHLRVIDFIGNYANNFLIPIALYDRHSRNKEDTRTRILERKTIAGLSSVSFEKVARERVLASLAKAKLDGIQQLKKDILRFQDEHNRLPKLIDFATLDLVDPVIMGSKYKNYWSLLVRAKFLDTAPTAVENRYLTFLSGELLNGKRPHELLVIRHLLRQGPTSTSNLASVLHESNAKNDDSTLESTLRMLTFDFLVSPQKSDNKYGDHPIIVPDNAKWKINPEFSELYFHSSNRLFREFVDDIIETGLYLSRERYLQASPFEIGKRYSRKDACRLLNWKSNVEGVLNGYRCDQGTKSCPIFVTYHKREEIDSHINYDEEFLDPKTFRWSTRSKTTLQTKDVAQIVSGQVELHFFIKKDDAEGLDFYYLGTAEAHNAVEGTMLGKDNQPVSVVRMDLRLNQEVAPDLYDYLQTPSAK